MRPAATSGALYRDSDKAWVDVVDDVVEIDGGRRSTWLASRTAGGICTACALDGSGDRLLTRFDGRRHRRRRRSTSGRLGLFHRVARRRDRAYPLSGEAGRQRRGRARDARRPTRGTHTYQMSRRRATGRSTPRHAPTCRRASISSRLRSIASCGRWSTTPRSREGGAAAVAAGGVLQGRRRRRRRRSTGGWSSRRDFDPSQEISASSSTSTASRRRRRSSIAGAAGGCCSIARSPNAGYVVVEHRQPRHAGAEGRRLAQGRVRRGRRSIVEGAGRRRARAARTRIRTSTRIASASGAGAAAARTRSTACSVFPTSSRSACRSRRCPTSGSTTRSTRSATWACRRRTPTAIGRLADQLRGGLKGKLLIVHGSGDDNVHYQGTERLVNRLVELGKPFDVMVYPNRTHAISEGAGHHACTSTR